MRCVSSWGVRSSATHTHGVSIVFCMCVGAERLTHGLVRLRAVDALDADRALVDILAFENLLGEKRVREGGRHSVDGVHGLFYLGDTYDLLPVLCAKGGHTRVRLTAT